MSSATHLLFRDDPLLKTCTAQVVAAAEQGIVLDRTVFFPAGGGQPGDTGSLAVDSASFTVINTVRDRESKDVIHCIEGELPAVGSEIVCTLDWERRYRIMRTHTAMHLLGTAGAETVTGGNFQPLRGRLDFDMPEPPNRERIEEKVNEFVAADAEVTTQWVDWDYLDAHPELIKTMIIRPPRTQAKVSLVSIAGIDLQACGGTHVARTSEVGKVRIVKTEKKGKLNRRIVIQLDEN